MDPFSHSQKYPPMTWSISTQFLTNFDTILEQPTYYFQFCYNLQFSTLRNLHLKTTKGDDYDMMDPDFRVKNHLCS